MASAVEAWVPFTRHKPSLAPRTKGCEARAAQGLGRRHDAAAMADIADADEGCRHMGEGSEIARRADRSLAWYHGRYVVVDESEERFGELRPCA